MRDASGKPEQNFLFFLKITVLSSFIIIKKSIDVKVAFKGRICKDYKDAVADLASAGSQFLEKEKIRKGDIYQPRATPWDLNIL